MPETLVLVGDINLMNVADPVAPFARVGEAKSFGISVGGAGFDYAAMVGRKDGIVDQLQSGVKQLLTANGVKQFSGMASFKDRQTIAIDGVTTIGGIPTPAIRAPLKSPSRTPTATPVAM